MGMTLDSLLNCTSLKFCEPRSFILEPIECDTSIKKYHENSSKLGTDEECTMTNKNKLLSNFDAFYYTKTKCNKKGKRTFMSNKLLSIRLRILSSPDWMLLATWVVCQTVIAITLSRQ